MFEAGDGDEELKIDYIFFASSDSWSRLLGGPRPFEWPSKATVLLLGARTVPKIQKPWDLLSRAVGITAAP
ncbi:hypothetical protein GCM10017600_69070 [Streptosporangium carneum]|uniref:Uncharacterized protein n=1 Tax=Streptosporangium carneum TaxID=47481 RepID=A0A9W6MGQ8_9ACTN|nr:hypothetical protein GCM10017600_69070 [Streptosporangium carneum]